MLPAAMLASAYGPTRTPFGTAVVTAAFFLVRTRLVVCVLSRYGDAAIIGSGTPERTSTPFFRITLGAQSAPAATTMARQTVEPEYLPPSRVTRAVCNVDHGVTPRNRQCVVPGERYFSGGVNGNDRISCGGRGGEFIFIRSASRQKIDPGVL